MPLLAFSLSHFRRDFEVPWVYYCRTCKSSSLSNSENIFTVLLIETWPHKNDSYFTYVKTLKVLLCEVLLLPYFTSVRLYWRPLWFFYTFNQRHAAPIIRIRKKMLFFNTWKQRHAHISLQYTSQVYHFFYWFDQVKLMMVFLEWSFITSIFLVDDWV